MTITPVSRRFAACLAAAVVSVSTLTACGSSTEDTAQSSDSTREFANANGTTVKLPKEPKKIVALSETSIDDTLALGIKPVGITAGRGQQGAPSYLVEHAKGIPVVATLKEPNLDQILSLEPDLIIVDDTTGARNKFEELQKIAPTAWVGNPSKDWKAYFTRISDALGKSSKAKEILTNIDKKIATTKAKVKSKLPATASIVRWAEDGPAISGVDSLSSTLLKESGITRPAKQQNIKAENRAGQIISLEQLDLIDADFLYIGSLGDVDSGEKAVAQARKRPNFASLKAVRDGHVKIVDGTAWTSSSGPLGVNVILDDIAASVS